MGVIDTFGVVKSACRDGSVPLLSVAKEDGHVACVMYVLTTNAGFGYPYNLSPAVTGGHNDPLPLPADWLSGLE